MKWHRFFGRAFTFAGQLLWRNGWLSVALVLVFILTLTAGHVLVGVQVLSRAVIADIEERVDVSVYFAPGTSQEIVVGAQEYLTSLASVKAVRFVSAEEGRTRFLERHKNDPVLLQTVEAVGKNPFGDALIVRTASPADFPVVIEAMRHPRFSAAVERIDENNLQGVIAEVEKLVQQIRWVTYTLAAVFCAIATLMLFNAVRLAVYTHREEIGIMRLVGASRGFIRAPFALQSVVLGWVAVCAATVLALLGAWVVEEPLRSFFNGRSVGIWSFYASHLPAILGIQFVGITLLAALFSLFATSRYLRGQG
jgi:cell division transport system permease protein